MDTKIKMENSTTSNNLLSGNIQINSQFIDYWDKVIKDWLNGIIDKEQSAYRNIMNTDYMPEPYIGNPNNCSFVIVNYNAGAGDSKDPHNYKDCANCCVNRYRLICYVKDHSYSQFELPFPCLMSDDELKKRNWEWIKSYSGYKWWQQKKGWLNNVTKAAGLPSYEDGVMPFAIELCGWHSKSWSNTNDIINNPQLKNVVEKRVIDIIKFAIDNSRAKFAYFIGKKHIPLLESYDFEWKAGDNPNNYTPQKGDNRFFAIYQHKVSHHKALVTWTIGSNTHPGKNSYTKEAKIIQLIQSI
jgi:hypothetical protein